MKLIVILLLAISLAGCLETYHVDKYRRNATGGYTLDEHILYRKYTLQDCKMAAWNHNNSTSPGMLVHGYIIKRCHT